MRSNAIPRAKSRPTRDRRPRRAIRPRRRHVAAANSQRRKRYREAFLFFALNKISGSVLSFSFSDFFSLASLDREIIAPCPRG